MGIDVRHGANPSVVLAAKYGAGQNAARRQAQLAGAQAAERRNAREDEQEFRREMTAGGQQFQREMAGEQFGRRQELMELGQDLRQEDYEFRLTAQQRLDQEKWRNALYWAKTTDELSDEVRQGGTSERQEAIRRAEARIAGAEDLLPARKEPSKYPKGQGMGESWTTPEGLILTRDAQGNVKKIGESRTQPTYQDRIKAWNLALEANQNSETGKFDMEAVKALYAQIMGSSGGGGMQLDPSAALGHQAPAAGASVLGQFATDEQGPVAPGEQASAARQPLPILGADQARALSQFVAGKPAMLTADQTRALDAEVENFSGDMESPEYKEKLAALQLYQGPPEQGGPSAASKWWWDVVGVGYPSGGKKAEANAFSQARKDVLLLGRELMHTRGVKSKEAVDAWNRLSPDAQKRMHAAYAVWKSGKRNKFGN